ncbi:hypothetical protein D9619_012044 [Psilocybe cf. subviscida]|uniref:DUF7702 domain-containing protein n=1 Tax=Psilocybe cf. subviscida TaxID=2480587 RepID=A0A8H5B7E3_9AGAR|nr:hypothetical protein D9619_012044 [Psilocybe cf. subviscida]
MSPTAQINFAKAIGFDSLAAAIIFTIIYVPLEGWFLLKSFTRPTYVHFALSFFCAIRIAAFALRAVLISSNSVGQNLNVLIADEILSAIGFFSLLYSAYTLVLDIELLSGREASRNPIIALTRNRRLFRVALIVAVALGIAGLSSSSSNSSTGSIGSGSNSTLHKVSTGIFVALTALQAFQTVILALEERRNRGYARSHPYESFGSKHAGIILTVMSILLLVREAFSAATVNNFEKQNDEKLWYPLLATPEVIVVLLFGTPGLVPDRKELAERVPRAINA